MDMKYQINRLEPLVNVIETLIEEAGKIASIMQLQTEIAPEVMIDATNEWYDSLNDDDFGVQMPPLPWFHFVLEYYKDLIADTPQEN